MHHVKQLLASIIKLNISSENVSDSQCFVVFFKYNLKFKLVGCAITLQVLVFIVFLIIITIPSLHLRLLFFHFQVLSICIVQTTTNGREKSEKNYYKFILINFIILNSAGAWEMKLQWTATVKGEIHPRFKFIFFYIVISITVINE